MKLSLVLKNIMEIAEQYNIREHGNKKDYSRRALYIIDAAGKLLQALNTNPSLSIVSAFAFIAACINEKNKSIVLTREIVLMLSSKEKDIYDDFERHFIPAEIVKVFTKASRNPYEDHLLRINSFKTRYFAQEVSAKSQVAEHIADYQLLFQEYLTKISSPSVMAEQKSTHAPEKFSGEFNLNLTAIEEFSRRINEMAGKAPSFGIPCLIQESQARMMLHASSGSYIITFDNPTPVFRLIQEKISQQAQIEALQKKLLELAGKVEEMQKSLPVAEAKVADVTATASGLEFFAKASVPSAAAP